MSQKGDLNIPKVRSNDPRTIDRLVTGQPTSLREKVFAKVVNPLKARSKSSLGNLAAHSGDLSIRNSRASCDFPRSSYDSGSQISNGGKSFSRPENLPQTVHAHRTSALLRPSIRILPEVATLDHASQKDLWTIVEIFGEAKMDGTPSKPLDIVVIFDCSAYVSSACLEIARRTLLDFASHLSGEDRLAIIASSQRHTSDDSSCMAGCVIRPLKPPERSSIESDLRHAIVRRAKITPRNVDLGENLIAAFRILGYPPFHASGHIPFDGAGIIAAFDAKRKHAFSKSRDASSMIVVISPNHPEICGVVGDMSPVPVHVIQPGVLPWPSASEEFHGWKLSTSCLDNDSSWPHLRTKKLIEHARTATQSTEVMHLNVEVEPSPGCSIKKVIGMQKYYSLCPGETISLGVLVGVPPLQGCNDKTNPPMTRFERNERLIRQLETMLGTASQDVFSVRVSFRSSNCSEQQPLPIDTQTWSLNRHDPQSEWLGHSPEDVAKSQEASRSQAYRRLMLLVAQSTPIDEACDALERVSMNSLWIPEVEATKRQLEDEIRFQIDIIKRRSSTTDSLRTRSDSVKRFSTDSRSPSIKFTPELLFGAHTWEGKPEPLPKDVPPGELLYGHHRLEKENLRLYSDQQRRSTSSQGSVDSNATTVHHDVDVDVASQDEDEARKIWKVMRRNSKSEKQERRAASAMSEDVGASDEKSEAIRRRALQSKRSIGADTLRSLSLDAEFTKRDHPAPWL